MEEISFEAKSSPLATVEEIQRRLLRPPALHSHSSIPIPIPIPYISSSRDNDLRKQGNSSSSPIDLKTMKKTLEDYLNPVILSTVRAGMKKRKVVGELKRWEELDEFKWPIDELKMFKEDSGRKWRNEEEEEEAEEGVNLGDDSDLIGEDGDGGGDGEVCCTPFGKFEVMALKKFKGGG